MWNKLPLSPSYRNFPRLKRCVYVYICVCVCMRALIPAHLPRGYARFLPPLEKKKAREEVIASPPSPPSTSGDLLLSLSLPLVRSRYRRLEMQKRLWKSNRITLFFWDLIKSSSLTFEPKGDIFSPGFFLSSPCLPQPSRPNAIIDGVISSLDKFIYTTISRLLVPRFWFPSSFFFRFFFFYRFSRLICSFFFLS